MKRAGVALILLFAFFGLSNSLYLTQSEANNAPLLCTVDTLSGCNIVAASQYSRLFGVSIAEYGIVFYAFIFFVAALELVVFNRLLRRVLQGASFVGVLVSAYLTFLEIFVIQALCIYCLASAFIALLILIFASLIEPVGKRA
ncbi:MAG: vitamin K epoxide reductase family protein [Candidatus Paceibacterota bacterium]|jgi:uncharacterized membrane protein